MKFKLPADLPVPAAELTVLRDEATAEISEIVARFDADADLTADDVADLAALNASVDTLDAAIAVASAADEAHRTAVNDAVERARAAATVTASDESDDEDEGDEGDEGDETDETDEVDEVDEAPPVVASAKPTKKTKAPVSFRQIGDQAPPAAETGPAWVVDHGAPGFGSEDVGTKVGFAQMAVALDSVRKGHRVGRVTSTTAAGPFMRQNIAHMTRQNSVEAGADLSPQAVFNLLNKLTNEKNLPGGSLVAAGGWCAPSEQIYTFCDVEDATDLVDLPQITINRGGLRWPVEPDLTGLFSEFEFFFTEPELEAVDGEGVPTAFKHCVEIPCPDEFEEIRLNAVGFCIEAGILQKQGWPESIEFVMRNLMQEHLRAMSRRTLRDMWNGGAPVLTFDASLAVGGTSGVLNALALYAYNLRSHRGLPRTATIEGKAPAWFFEALRADLANQLGLGTDHYYVTDAQILAWLAARNLQIQFVGDWQSRGANQPGNLATMRWPGHVDIMLYPAGTWFQSQSNIIEVGVLYPKEQLQINRYTEMFTEDAIAVGKRCGVSANLRIPLCLNGGYGAPVTISCSDTTGGIGGDFDATPPGGGTDGQKGMPTTTTITMTGTPTGGNITATYEGDDFTIGFGATAAAVLASLVALNDGLQDDDFTVTGGALPGTPIAIVARGGGAVTIKTKALTGGTSPNASATVS